MKYVCRNTARASGNVCGFHGCFHGYSHWLTLLLRFISGGKHPWELDWIALWPLMSKNGLWSYAVLVETFQRAFSGRLTRLLCYISEGKHPWETNLSTFLVFENSFLEEICVEIRFSGISMVIMSVCGFPISEDDYQWKLTSLSVYIFRKTEKRIYLEI